MVSRKSTVTPDLELVGVRGGESFKMWSHGYPYRTVRWHFHPEYEIHLITDTAGKAFVGDYVGDFRPGNLVMIGPNLPHNWISHLPDGETVAERCLVLQFTGTFIRSCLATFPELDFVDALLQRSSRGIQFCPATGAAAGAIMQDLLTETGARRVGLFLSLLDLLARSGEYRLLAGLDCCPQPSDYMAGKINLVIAHIGEHLREDLRESDLAKLAGYNPGAFSRAFRRHTGMNFVDYVACMRTNLACQMLMHDQCRITDICYQIGFNNLSNFNRQFRTRKGMSPSEFRHHHRVNSRVSRLANHALALAAPAATDAPTLIHNAL